MHEDRKNVLAYRVIFTALLLLLALVTLSVTTGGSVPAADLRFDAILYALRTPALVSVAKAVSLLGETVIVLLITAAVCGILFSKKLRAKAVGLAITVLGAGGSAYILKEAFARARPPAPLPAAIETSFSFPSGHAALSMTLYGFGAYLLCRRYPNLSPIILAAATLLILIVGFSRLYLGVHYPSDVVGGYLVGGLWIIVGTWTAGSLERKNGGAIVR